MATTLANFRFLRPSPGGRPWLWRSIRPEPLLVADGGPSARTFLGSDRLQTSCHVVVTSEHPVTTPSLSFFVLPNHSDLSATLPSNWWKLCRETKPLRTRPAAIFLPLILPFKRVPNRRWMELKWLVSFSSFFALRIDLKLLKQLPKNSDRSSNLQIRIFVCNRLYFHLFHDDGHKPTSPGSAPGRLLQLCSRLAALNNHLDFSDAIEGINQSGTLDRLSSAMCTQINPLARFFVFFTC